MYGACILVVFVSLVSAKNADYMGYKVYNIEFKTEEQQNRFDLIKSDGIDYWRKPSLKHGIVGQVMVAPSHFPWFEEQLDLLNIKEDVFIEDVYEYLLKKEKLVRTKRSDPETEPDRPFDYQRYYRYDDILKHMRNIEVRYVDSEKISVELIEFGKTAEERDLVYLKITNPNEALEKPVIIIEAGIVPREWITIPTAFYILDKILEESNSFLDEFDWIIIPVVNPDGYEYTHTNLRLWTKSRSTKTHLDFICPGVHINRNFDFDWSVSDSSSSPCSHLYAGINAFSEIESQMLASIIDSYERRISLYISLQNSGGFISFPWNYERAASGLFREHILLSLDMAEVMTGNYRVDVASAITGDRASGTSLDYAKDKGGFFTYNFDIAHEDHGVLVPEDEIVKVVEDVWKGVSFAVNNMNKYIPK